jgi:hypothetical protein
VRALIGIDSCPMAAAIVRATDQEATNASGAHFCESDLLGEGGQLHDSADRASREAATGWARNRSTPPPVPRVDKLMGREKLY